MAGGLVGLLGVMSELDAISILEGNEIFREFKGAPTEQYVLQQRILDTSYTPYYYGTESANFDERLPGRGMVVKYSFICSVQRVKEHYC